MNAINQARIIKLIGLGIILYADWRIFLGYILVKTGENFAIMWGGRNDI